MTGSPDKFVTVARIARTQGRRGEVAAQLLTDFPERFAQRRRLFALDPKQQLRRELELEGYWPHKGGMIFKFRGLDSISQAESLLGCEIQISAEERAQLPPGSAWLSDLVGCELWDERGGNPRKLGRISAVQPGAGEAPLLVVAADQKELLVPFAAEYLIALEPQHKRLRMTLPEGLLSLDAPLTEEEKRMVNRSRTAGSSDPRQSS